MKGNKQRRQLFPEKLWELVNSQQNSGIRWSPTNYKCIEIERSKLERFLQTKFRSHNFDSFIRQLHFYGFKKCGNSYYHDKFQRDQPDGIHTMKRKYSSLPMPNHHHHAHHRNHHNLHHHNPPPVATVATTTNCIPTTLSSTTRPPAVRPESEIKLYTLDSTSDEMSFTNVRETSAKAIKNDKGLKICIPKSSMPNSDQDSANSTIGSWPKSLVLESYRHGEQSILSAFFIYRLN